MVEQKRKKRSEKWKVILSVTAVVLVVAIVGVVVGFNWRERYDTGYFVSDDSKLVVSLGRNIASFKDGDYEPKITHMVYYYEGEDVNGMKIFFEYEDEASAKVANDNISVDEMKWAVSKALNGRFIVFEVLENQYKGLKVKDVRHMIENIKDAGASYEDEEDGGYEDFDDDNTE